jgi:hypothetical protein
MTQKVQTSRSKPKTGVQVQAKRVLKKVAKTAAVSTDNGAYFQSKPTPQADSKVLCVECDQPIPLARLKIVKTDTCVRCMEELELQDKIQKVRTVDPQTRGTIRHSMEFQVEGIEEVESIELHIRRGG